MTASVGSTIVGSGTVSTVIGRVVPGTAVTNGTALDKLLAFDEGIVMWWNFIGRSHEDIVRMRQEWNDAPDDRFGRVAGYRGPTQRLAAPPLPADLKLKRRFRRGRQ